MPPTKKGEEIESAMKQEYGEKKGEEVFYASKNKGTISGVDNVLNWAGGEHVMSPGGNTAPKGVSAVDSIVGNIFGGY
jgi:hypothetical protein